MFNQFKAKYPDLTVESFLDNVQLVEDSNGIIKLNKWTLEGDPPNDMELAEMAKEASAEVVAVSVDKVNLLIVLDGMGITESQIEAEVGTDSQSLIRFKHSTTIKSDHDLVATLAEKLNLDSSQVSDIFTRAAGLTI